MNLHIVESHVEDGNMSYLYGEENIVTANKTKFFAHYKEVEKTIKISVLHQNKILLVKNNVEPEIKADAIITKIPKTIFYICFGDCLPLIVWDKKQHLVAFAHLGLIDIDHNFHQEVINYLIDNCASSLADLEIILGPCIKKESYVLTNPKEKLTQDWNNYLEKYQDGYQIEMKQKVMDEFTNLNLKIIENNTVDTYQNPLYFSHHQAITEKLDNEGRFIYGFYLNS